MVLYFSQNAAMRDGVTSLCTEEHDTDTISPKAHFFRLTKIYSNTNTEEHDSSSSSAKEPLKNMILTVVPNKLE